MHWVSKQRQRYDRVTVFALKYWWVVTAPDPEPKQKGDKVLHLTDKWPEVECHLP